MKTLLIAVLALGCRSVWAAELVFRSGPETTALLELFSSEGCSSCPPADDQLRAWAAGPGLWKEFVPVVYHVDYWDYLGWADPFAQNQHTWRQREYAKQWGSRVYTPCFALNGREWQRGSRDQPGAEGVTGVLEIRSPVGSKVGGFGTRHRVKYSPAKGQKGPWLVNMVLLGFGLVSPVRMGENAGKTLHHDAVVLAHSDVLLKAGEGVINLPAASVKREAYLTDRKIQSSAFMPKPKRLAVAAWVTLLRGTTVNDGMSSWVGDPLPPPLQAAGGFLN